MVESIEDLIPKVSRDDYGEPLILQFKDDESGTNLFFIQRGSLSPEWEVKDGRATVERIYWRGPLNTVPSILSALIRFGGNTAPRPSEV